MPVESIEWSRDDEHHRALPQPELALLGHEALELAVGLRDRGVVGRAGAARVPGGVDLRQVHERQVRALGGAVGAHALAHERSTSSITIPSLAAYWVAGLIGTCSQ